MTAEELGEAFDVAAVLRFGTLPAVQASTAKSDRIDLLQAYVENYLTQEIRLEAVVKSLESFTRFIDVAATVNGQVVNVAGIARDAAVARPTVQGYFEILVDTLVGSWLPAWRPRAKVKEVAHPKFYFFDPGVVRAIARRLHDPLGNEERGALLETYVLHELRAWINRSGVGGELCYWRTPSGSEVDLVWRRGASVVAIEVKSSTRWRSGDATGLRAFGEVRPPRRSLAVYLGRESLRDGKVEVLPLAEFLAALARGDLVG